MSYGQTPKPCENYRAWKGQEPLCGNCAWLKKEHTVSRTIEKERLLTEIREMEEQLKPKRLRLTELYEQEADIAKGKVKSTHQGKDKFALDELIFAATNRCPCGAGLAYPKNIGPWGSWDCSDILLGRATPKGEEGSKEHTGELPFSFYEIKSEQQLGNKTTRPEIL